ncbi:hypothetical protein L1887_58580 [Cichorium endivia]|nr:hypothetical protein L1887_58580 [Cichorium endivia]
MVAVRRLASLTLGLIVVGLVRAEMTEVDRNNWLAATRNTTTTFSASFTSIPWARPRPKSSGQYSLSNKLWTATYPSSSACTSSLSVDRPPLFKHRPCAQIESVPSSGRSEVTQKVSAVSEILTSFAPGPERRTVEGIRFFPLLRKLAEVYAPRAGNPASESRRQSDTSEVFTRTTPAQRQLILPWQMPLAMSPVSLNERQPSPIFSTDLPANSIARERRTKPPDEDTVHLITLACFEPFSAEDTKAEDARTMPDPDPKKAKHSGRMWTDIVSGEKFGFSVDYLADRSAPWSKIPFETVLRPHDRLSGAGRILTSDEKLEIIGEVAAIFKREKGKYAYETPLIYFNGSDAHITIRDSALLEAIWKKQPIFRGKRMKLVSKGFPGKDITVYSVWGVRVMKKSDLMKSIPDHTKEQAALILASMYQVDEVGGEKFYKAEPIFSGDMIFFGRATFNERTFLDRPLTKVVHPTIY